MSKDLLINSKVCDGTMKSPNRAMLRAVGFEDEDFKKPMIGIASTWSEVTPCNIHIKDRAVNAKDGAREAGAAPMIISTSTVYDGISMGTDGRRYSLPSRDLIADFYETCVGSESLHRLVTIGWSDKNSPGCLVAVANAEGPYVFCYCGSDKPGQLVGEEPNLVSVFEGVGQHNN